MKTNNAFEILEVLIKKMKQIKLPHRQRKTMLKYKLLKNIAAFHAFNQPETLHYVELENFFYFYFQFQCNKQVKKN